MLRPAIVSCLCAGRNGCATIAPNTWS